MSVETEASPRPRSHSPRITRARPPRRPHRTHRVRRVFVLASIISIAAAVVSYIGDVSNPSNSSLGIRTVEWLRQNGARGLVNQVESIYYSMNAPATGGPPLRVLPHQASVTPGTTTRARRRIRSYRPARIEPVIRPALRGEGVWRATFAHSGSRPPVLITSYRPDPSYPQMVAGVAWIDTGRTTTWLYPGRVEPAVSMASRGPMEVPPDRRSKLVATFNSGFTLSDSGGGFASGGHTYAPMKDGVATILRYRDGRIDVTSWSGGPDVGANVIYARQNLPLIVQDSRVNPNLGSGPEWGATLGNAVRVWRSGIGVDSRGNLIYAAADYQTVGSLAAILRHAGAIRAMELDINAYWPSFITYGAPGASDPANLLSGMTRSPQRYLTPDDRDFFAVYRK